MAGKYGSSAEIECCCRWSDKPTWIGGGRWRLANGIGGGARLRCRPCSSFELTHDAVVQNDSVYGNKKTNFLKEII